MYVTRDGQFECHRVGVPALVIRFHAPLDVILRELDVEYLVSAWRSAHEILDGHAVDAARFRWGYGDPRAVDHGHPPQPILDPLGWVAAEASPREFAAVLPRGSGWRAPWDAIAAELEACDVPLCLGYDHSEAQTVTQREGRVVDNDDARTALEIVRVLGTDSPVEWALFDPWKRSRYLSELIDRDEHDLPGGEPTDPADAPWMRLGQAMFGRDETALADAMEAVRSEYSEPGARICIESTLRYLMMRPNDRS